MITIVEGPDCTGKSTLIKNVFGEAAASWHFGPPGVRGAWVEYLSALSDAAIIIKEWDNDQDVAECNRNYVLDRFIYGELIYPKVVKRPSTLDLIKVRMLERVLLAQQAIVVFCMTRQDLALELWRERQDTEFLQKEQQFLEAYTLWNELLGCGNIQLPYIMYDLERTSYESIKTAARMQRAPENKGPGIGMYRTSSIVLVGEQVNPNVDTNDWPFVAEDGSSYWLTQQLEELGVPENKLYWVNAIGREGFETPPFFLENLRPYKVITLGKTAELWAKRNKIEQWTKAVRSISHPAYHKRFKANETYQLEEAING